MRSQKLKQTILFAVIICTIFFCKLENIQADVYKDGLITVKHEELSVKRNGQRIQFNHPYKLSESFVTKVLADIYYKEKGLFKRKETLRVFQDAEIKKLVPLIVQAFSVATPMQVISVTSYSYRMILSDKKNYCIVFIAEHSLNIAFGRIHMFQTFNDIMSEKKRYLTTRENPAKKRRSSFWKLIPSAGQRLEPGHENWLIIDLSK
ncbi:MAG: hypothetical protein A2069_05665 [Planctomycetes bacterium GWB2_41_19]|nr:MAG: hypothetical protein A2069_05665 [Planctomycetes bacterium GWB2_41_19]OHB47098.1 MAG: hypothetical protein A2094_00970 [Planctomycetes bacterium GWE2_41_14]OHB98949.1 MAG: hypothetical protein A2Z58_06865 [Planctomycetes bacterium RIFCSPHIGHO2_12_42_15]